MGQGHSNGGQGRSGHTAKPLGHIHCNTWMRMHQGANKTCNAKMSRFRISEATATETYIDSTSGRWPARVSVGAAERGWYGGHGLSG